MKIVDYEKHVNLYAKFRDKSVPYYYSETFLIRTDPAKVEN